MKKSIVFLSVFLLLVLSLFSQTDFAGLGVSDSGGSGFKTVSNNADIVVSNLMLNDGSEMYRSTETDDDTWILKATGVEDFTFIGMSLRLIVDLPDNTDVSSSVTFKDKFGATIQTMTLNSNKKLPDTAIQLATFFDNGTTTPIYNVAEIVFDLKNPVQNFSQDYNYVDITISQEQDPELPVALSSFTAINYAESNELQWTTQSESNNLGWNVYRSLSGNLVDSSILNSDLITGAGTTSEPTNYQYSDYNDLTENEVYYYWIEDVTNSGDTDLHGPVSVLISNNIENPDSPDLDVALKMHNYPNPFNPDTQISFDLSEDEIAHKIEIYNTKGELIQMIESPANPQLWNGKDSADNDVTSGLYFYKLSTNRKSYIKKMILMK